MSHMNNDPRDPFTERLSALLAQSADTIRPHPNFVQQVRRRARTAAYPRRELPRFAPLFASLKPASSFALTALVVGSLAWLLTGPGFHSFISGLQSASPTPSPTASCDNSPQNYNPNPPTQMPPDHSVAIGKSVTADGVTITLDRAYADAIQTMVVYHVTHTATFKGAYGALTDATGRRYAVIDSKQDTEGDPVSGVISFAPLPQQLLGKPQRLIWSSVEELPEGATPPASTVAMGPWVIPFTITPVAGVAVPLSLAPQTHDGVTVQPEEMDIAPAGGGIDEQNGGVRVRIQVSGLPATMPLYDVARYAFYFGRTGPGYGCGGKLTLRLPGGKEIIPGSIRARGEYVPIALSDVAKAGLPTVGSSGSAEIEAIFYTPVQPGPSIMTLTLDHIPLSMRRDGQVVETSVANGPWVFDLPMSAPSGN